MCHPVALLMLMSWRSSSWTHQSCLTHAEVVAASPRSVFVMENASGSRHKGATPDSQKNEYRLEYPHLSLSAHRYVPHLIGISRSVIVDLEL